MMKDVRPQKEIQSCDVDHLVIVTPDLDASRDEFAALGFTVSPRQEHKIFGTANHLITLSGVYIELLGVVNQTAPDLSSRKFIQPTVDEGGGLSLVALTHPEPHAIADALSTSGYAVEAPKSWSREALTPDGKRTAAFTTFFFSPSLLPDTQTFFCRQQTPQYVYHPALQIHANQTQNLFSVTRYSSKPKSELERLLGWSTAAPTTGKEILIVPVGKYDFIYRNSQQSSWEIDLAGSTQSHRCRLKTVANMDLLLPLNE
jgi:hypothetical protein